MRSKIIVALSLASTVFIMVMLFATLRVRSSTEKKSGEKCLECHKDSVAYKEWKESAHAGSLETVRKIRESDSRCIACHSADYNRYTVGSAWGSQVKLPTPKEAIDPISCSACHRHDTGIKHNLIVSADKLCIKCHKVDCGCFGIKHEHSQAEMFAGTEGLGVKNMPSQHSQQMPEKCIVCHAYKDTKTEKFSEDGKTLIGGHTFRVDYSVCLKCHENPKGLLAEWEAKLTPLVKELEKLLDTYDDKSSKTYIQSKRNYSLVTSDGGYGLHNPPYAQELLKYSISALKSEKMTNEWAGK